MTNREAALEQFFQKHPRKQLRDSGLDWMYMSGGIGSIALVILPGSLNSAETGFEHVELLEKSFRVLTPSFPGDATSMREVVDGIHAIFDAEGLNRVNLIGTGFGGMVAQCMVRIYPSRVGKLVLSQSGGPDQTRGVRNQALVHRLRYVPTAVLRYLMKMGMRKAASRFQEDQEFWTKSMVAAVGEMRRASFLNFYRRTADFDLNYRFQPTDLPDAATRVLLLDSDEDPIDGDAPDSLKSLYPGARVHTFEDVGNMAAILKPQEYVGVIRQFLEENPVRN